MGTVKYSGPVASFHCPTEATIRSLKVHFSPKQLGEGTPSPENVREIVGWDGVTVKRSGENLFPPAAYERTINGITFIYFLNGDVHIKGTATSDCFMNVPSTMYFTITPGMYTISGNINNSNVSLYLVVSSANGGDIKFRTISSVPTTKEITFTDSSARAQISVSNGKTVNVTIHPKLERGSYTANTTTNYEFGVLGKNKFDYSTANIIDKKRRDDTGTVVSDATGSYCQTLIPVSPNATYTLSGYPVNNNSKRIYYIDAEENFIERTTAFGDSNYTFTTPNNCYYIQIQNREVGENASWETIQLELGSTATTYEPYDPNKTVYGGWVDLISGEVCEEYGFLTENSGGTIASIVDRNDGYYSIIINFDADKRPYSSSGSLCNILNYNSTLTAQNNEYAFYYYLNQQAWKAECRIYSATPLATVDEAKTYLNQLGFKLAYKIPIPITYHIAPTTLQTFLSHNNVWSNADYVEVEYDLHETQSILARK